MQNYTEMLKKTYNRGMIYDWLTGLKALKLTFVLWLNRLHQYLMNILMPQISSYKRGALISNVLDTIMACRIVTVTDQKCEILRCLEFKSSAFKYCNEMLKANRFFSIVLDADSFPHGESSNWGFQSITKQILLSSRF